MPVPELEALIYLYELCRRHARPSCSVATKALLNFSGGSPVLARGADGCCLPDPPWTRRCQDPPSDYGAVIVLQHRYLCFPWRTRLVTLRSLLPTIYLPSRRQLMGHDFTISAECATIIDVVSTHQGRPPPDPCLRSNRATRHRTTHPWRLSDCYYLVLSLKQLHALQGCKTMLPVARCQTR